MPDTADEAIAVADAIGSGQLRDWGKASLWPNERIKAGDWTPAQWYDSELAEAVFQLERSPHLAPANLSFGATGRAAQDSWVRCEEEYENPDRLMVFDSVSAKIRQTMSDVPEQAVVPGGRRAHLFENVRASSANLMLATRFDTVSGRLTSLWSETPTFGFGWIPAKGADAAHEQALCAWWNSTPGRLLLLNRRAKKLTYPKWSVEHLTSVPCPKHGSERIQDLAMAWQSVCQVPLLPMHKAEACEVRRIIDEAAALAIGADAETLSDWRRRLAAEPTVSNVRASCADPEDDA